MAHDKAMRSGAILHKQIIEGPAVYCLGRDQWSRARTCSGDGGEISQATAAYCANASREIPLRRMADV